MTENQLLEHFIFANRMECKRINVEDDAGNKYDLIEVDGTLFPDYFADDPASQLTDVRAMEGRDDDVIIAAFPKAVAFGSWFDYTQEWGKTMTENQGYPIHTVCFDDLKRDSLNTVKKLAQFLNAKSDDTFISEVCKRCSFTKLKNAYEKTKQLFDEGHNNPLAYTFRKGEIGDWKNWYTVSMNEKFDHLLESKLPGYSKQFIYE